MACAGRFAEARAACAAEMGRDDPNTAALWLYTLGRVLYDACELGPAVERLTDALQRPSPPGSAKGLLRSAQRLEAERAAGNGAFKRGEWANAAAAYTRALQARAPGPRCRARAHRVSVCGPRTPSVDSTCHRSTRTTRASTRCSTATAPPPTATATACSTRRDAPEMRPR